MAAAALVVSVTNSISFVKELLESAGDAPPSHEILVECEVVLTKCLFVTSSSGMYWYSMEGEVGIYSMFFI